MTTSDVIQGHYGFGSILEQIESGLRAMGKDPANLTSEDLSPVDAFHSRGKTSTLELAQLAKCKPGEKILDVGCGLGGSVRYLAEEFDCHVTGLDLTQEYIDVAKALAEKVGLNDKVRFDQGSALELPYGDASFDVVWTEHAQMNIADKNLFYAEIKRVLKPGGRLIFHDILKGSAEEPYFPVPWAEVSHMSALVAPEDARVILENLGFEIQDWINKSEISLDFFEKVVEKIKAEGAPPLGIHLLMGDSAPEKIKNYIRNLKENKTAVFQGVATKR